MELIASVKARHFFSCSVSALACRAELALLSVALVSGSSVARITTVAVRPTTATIAIASRARSCR